MVDVVIHLQEIDIVVIAVVVVDVECPGALNIVVCRILEHLLGSFKGCFGWVCVLILHVSCSLLQF